MNALQITAPVTVQILTAPPAPESKASAAIREREAVAMVLRAVTVAYYQGVLS